MKYRTASAVVILAFMALAVFGLYMPGHDGHAMGCPFSAGQAVLCESSLLHLERWQSVVAAVLLNLIVAAALSSTMVFGLIVTLRSPEEHERYRTRAPDLPPALFQELFSRGILNSKAP